MKNPKLKASEFRLLESRRIQKSRLIPLKARTRNVPVYIYTNRCEIFLPTFSFFSFLQECVKYLSKTSFPVRPLEMNLSGVVGHVVQGTKILLQCTVRAARPAANISWKNGTKYLNESNDRFDMFETKIQENVSTSSESLRATAVAKLTRKHRCAVFYSLR